MPELTTVQFMTDNLSAWLAGNPILEISVLKPAKGARYQLEGITLPFQPSLIYRRGKHSLLQSDDGVLVISYNLSGKIISVPTEEITPKHRIRFLCADQALVFIDRIALGEITWLPAHGDSTSTAEQWCADKKLGPEPWPSQRDGNWWRQRCSSRSTIHSAMLSQRRVAGIGNILSQEGLFRSGIHPLTQAIKLSNYQWNCLAHGMHSAIEHSHNQHLSLRAASNQPFRGELSLASEGHRRAEGYLIYGRTGEPCPVCGTPIQKIKTKNRPVYWCQNCQSSSG